MNASEKSRDEEELKKNIEELENEDIQAEVSPEEVVEESLEEKLRLVTEEKSSPS